MVTKILISKHFGVSPEKYDVKYLYGDRNNFSISHDLSKEGVIEDMELMKELGVFERGTPRIMYLEMSV